MLPSTMATASSGMHTPPANGVVQLSPNTTNRRRENRGQHSARAEAVPLPSEPMYEATASSLFTAFTPGRPCGPCGPVRPRGPGYTASIRSTICSLTARLPSGRNG